MINRIKNIHPSLKATGCLVVLLAVFNLIGSNLLATRGHEVEKLSVETLSLQKENTHLTNQISQLSSLSYIESQASLHGFQKINKPVVVTSSSPVALLPR